jgi:sterol desaturase/sphingolipid hydroxylase (fatty acid hydroxylase superfamily)
MTLAPPLAAALGALAWTLLEYAIHRGLGHHRRLARLTPFGVEHTAHHARGHHFAPTWKKAVAAAGALALVAPAAVAALGPGPGRAFAAGLLAAYVAYEVLHRRLHTAEGVGPFGRWARRHHFFHHFHDPRRNHGVTSPLWDVVFGTYSPVARVEVPAKLAMRWLVDPATGAVRSHLAGRYRLRGGPAGT